MGGPASGLSLWKHLGPCLAVRGFLGEAGSATPGGVVDATCSPNAKELSIRVLSSANLKTSEVELCINMSVFYAILPVLPVQLQPCSAA